MPGGTVKYSIVADAKPFVDATAQASKELGKLTEQAVGSAGSLGSIAAAAGPMGKALAVATGVGVAGFAALAAAVATSVKGLVETGGKLADLSAQTGISTQALQKLAYAGSLVGVSQEQITGAAVKMEKALANGDSVFQRLGLSVQKLKAMQPDQAFAAIAAQIALIKNPTDQAAAAMEVFGKSGATLLPLIKSDLKAAGEEAEKLGIILSDKTVSAADALGDEATKLGAAWDGVKNQFAAAIIQNPALLGALQGLVTKMGDLAQALIANKDRIGSWVSSFIGGIQEIGRAFSALASNPVFQKLVMGSASALANFLQLPALASAAGLLAGRGSSAGSGTGHMSPGSSYAAINGGGGGLNFTAKGAQADADAAQKAWQTASEKARTEWDKFYQAQQTNGRAAFFALENDADKYAKKLAANRVAEFIDTLKQKEMLLKLGEQNDAIFEAAHQKKLAEMRDMAGALSGLGDQIEGVAGAWLHFASGGLSAFANLKDQALQSANLWQKVTIAIEGAAAAYSAGKSAGSPGKGALAGAGKGAAAGAAFGPYGVVIGAVAGAAIGFFGGKKAQAKEMKELTAEFEAASAAAAKAGIQFQHAFDTRSAKGLKSAIEEINHALDTQGEAQEKLQDALSRYNFTLAEQGPILAAQELDAKFAQIYQDWQLLTAAGVDHEAILRELGPNVSSYVDAAVTAGTEIPAAMKPIIDDLYTHGKLIHENGEAYTQAEVDGITYAQTMSQMFQDLIKHVEELVNAIRGVPDKTATITVRTVHQGDGGGDGGGGGDEVDSGDRRNPKGYATGGIFEPRPGGHVIRVAEGGQAEAVLNPGQMAAMAGGSPEALAELRQMNSSLRRLPDLIAQATRDAVMLSR